MLKKVRNKLGMKIAATYIGAIIGAGFASGQELVKFFAVFNRNGIWGALIAGILFAVVGLIVLKLVQMYGIESYDQLLERIFGQRISKIVDGMLTLFLLLGLAIMLVGSGSLFKETLGIPNIFGYLFTLIIVFIILVSDTNSILNVNYYLIPLLIVIATLVCLLSINNTNVVFIINSELKKGLIGNNWLLASVLYVGYNIVLGVLVLCSLGPKVIQSGVWGGGFGGIILGLFSALMVKALLNNPMALVAEMPMLVLAQGHNQILGIIYTISLWIALLTTALANGFSVVKRINKVTKLPNSILTASILLMTFPFISWEFSVLVSTIYPLMGYLGVLLFIGILLHGIKMSLR